MSQIQIESIKCINGCEFFPKILPNGTIKKYDRCRICRIYLDRKKVERGIQRKKKYLIHGQHRPPVKTHPKCTICDIILWDEQVLKKHKERLH